jgi:hypothetical protein
VARPTQLKIESLGLGHRVWCLEIGRSLTP